MVEAASGIIPSIERTPWACGEKQHWSLYEKNSPRRGDRRPRRAMTACSQERALDGTLGAVSGLVVAGPIGLIAGGVVGATAGPAIASSWGVRGGHHGRRRHRHHRRYRAGIFASCICFGWHERGDPSADMMGNKRRHAFSDSRSRRCFAKYGNASGSLMFFAICA
jgi:hypothetical protein